MAPVIAVGIHHAQRGRRKHHKNHVEMALAGPGGHRTVPRELPSAGQTNVGAEGEEFVRPLARGGRNPVWPKEGIPPWY